MRKFKGLILVGILCLSIVPAWAQEQKIVDFSIRQWFSFGNASWQESFPLPETSVRGESELEFDIDSPITVLSLELKPLYWLSAEANYGLGDISSGKWVDTDRNAWRPVYYYDPGTDTYYDSGLSGLKTGEWACSGADLEGQTKFYNVNTYLRLFPYQAEAKFFVDIFIGYQHYEDHLRRGDGVQRQMVGWIDDVPWGSPPSIDREEYITTTSTGGSSYDFNWDFLKIGLRAESFFGRHPGRKTNPPEPTNFSMRLSVALVPWISYKGEGIWINREDFRKDPSFRHEAEGLLFKDGGGLEGKISLTYSPWSWLLVEGGYQFLYLAVKNGVSTTYFVDGRQIKSKLDEVEVTRSGPFIGLSLRF